LKWLDPEVNEYRKPKTGGFRSHLTRHQHRQNEQIHSMQGEIMLTIRQKLSASLGIVFFFGCATLVSAAGNSDKLSDAREMLQRDEVASAVSSLEKALPPFIASQDYWSASKAYFQLAVARGRLNETRAGCAALSKSVDYYRQALVKDKLSLDYFGDMASDGSDDSEGMLEVSSRLGCERIRTA